MDTLQSLRVFLAVVEAGSFNKAAERLDISNAMASKHVAHLEKTLHTRLLNRNSRNLHLTEAGERYLPQCREALERLDYGADLARGEEGELCGTLKISTPTWFACAPFARLTHEFYQRYPRLRLDLDMNNRRSDLATQGYDFALRVTNQPRDQEIAIPIAPMPFSMVASPQLLPTERVSSLAALQELPAALPSYTDLSQITILWQEAPVTLTPNAIAHSDNTLMLYQWALAGVSAAFLPDWLVGEDLAAGRLIRLAMLDTQPVSRLHAVYPHRRYISLKSRSFIDFLRENLAKEM